MENCIKQIICKYNDIFYLPGDHLTYTQAAMHEIETSSNIPIYKRHYGFPVAVNNIIDEHME